MKKTFYSVKYSCWGYDAPLTKWFDNLEDAKKFSEKDYRDNVVTHTFKNPVKIAKIEEFIAMQDCEW